MIESSSNYYALMTGGTLNLYREAQETKARLDDLNEERKIDANLKKISETPEHLKKRPPSTKSTRNPDGVRIETKDKPPVGDVTRFISNRTDRVIAEMPSPHVQYLNATTTRYTVAKYQKGNVIDVYV